MKKLIIFSILFFSFFLSFGQNPLFIEEGYLKPGQLARGSSYFGTSMAYDSNNLVVGAIGAEGAIDPTTGLIRSSGAAFVFERSETKWVRVAKLIGPLTQNKDKFGQEVAIDGNTIVGRSRRIYRRLERSSFCF